MDRIDFNEDRLPSDVSTFADEDFYGLIQAILGNAVSDLLRFQCISSVSNFLLEEDIFEVFSIDIDDPDFDEIRKELCYPTKNGLIIVKHGIKTAVRCLKESLLRKIDKKKKTTKPRRQTLPSTAPTNNAQTQVALSSTPATTSTAILSLLTINQHKENLLKLLKVWCTNNEQNLKIERLILVEGNDFHLNLAQNVTDIEGYVLCQCEAKITLSKKDGKVIMSNFYRHLRDSECLLIKSLLNKQEEKKKLLQQSSSLISLSTTPSNITFSPSSTNSTIPSELIKRSSTTTHRDEPTPKRRKN